MNTAGYTVVVRKNWKKKIEALCAGNPTVTVYSLENNFIGEDFKPENMMEFVKRNNDSIRGSRLTYNKVTGNCCIHVHSNLIEWK